MNLWFFDYKKKYAPATIATYVSVICRLMRWIYDGQLPPAFLDLQSIKTSMRRKLKPDDMLLWEDALSLTRLTTSIQVEAILLAQLDGGFRPGEFIDLNYGDVTLVDGMYVCQVRDGKTGARPVVLYRATSATLALKNGAEIVEEQKWLAHSDISNTRLYDKTSFLCGLLTLL